MPKKAFTIEDFSGGLNTEISPRDLENNQLTTCTNADPSSKGRLLNTNVFVDDDTNFDDFGSVAPQVGAGLFVFSNDKTITDDGANTGDFILKSSDGTSIALQEVQDTDITITDLTGGTAVPAAPQFYAAEGDVYIGGDHSTAPCSVKFHSQNKFAAGLVDDWLTSTQIRTVPVIHQVGGASYNNDPTITHTSSSVIVVGQAVTGDGIPVNAVVDTVTDATHFELSASTTGGSKSSQTLTFRTMLIDEADGGTDANGIGPNNIVWMVKYGANDTGLWNNDLDATLGSGDYNEFGASWLYKNKAESDITLIGTNTTNGSEFTEMTGADDHVNSNLIVQAWMPLAPTAVLLDVYGARLYHRKNNESTWYLLSEIDYEKGIRGDGEADWAAWEAGTSSAPDFDHTNSGYQATTGPIFAPPTLQTFPTNNGYTTADIVDTVYWKYATVANGRAYVGNVNINGRPYGDRILKSPVFQYDVFVEPLFIDVASNDGDSITALAAYGDMLLEFKEKKLFLINISKELEYMDDVREHAGVKGPAAIAKTPFGVAWANTNGAYLYDGEEVTQLTMGKISDSDWKTNVGAAPSNIICGYDPFSRQLIVLWDGASGGTHRGKAYVFTFDTGTWHYVSDMVGHADNTAPDQNCTNMVNTSDGKLLIGGGTDVDEILVYDSRSNRTTATSQIDIRTGHLDLGNPGVKKNLLNVKVRYKYGGSDLAVNIITNDDSDDTGTTSTALTVNTDSGEDTNYLSEDDVDAIQDLQGQYWFQIKISGTAHASLDLDEVVLTYRELGVR